MKKKTNARAVVPVTRGSAAKDATGHLERVNGLLRWWGAPTIDFSASEDQIHCVQRFADGIQTLYRDASGRQLQLIEKTGAEITACATDLARPHRPSEIFGLQSAMAARLLDGVSHQSRLCTDVSEGFIDCYVAFARGIAEICHGPNRIVGRNAQ